ncbi:MAG: topoisomerase, partial [Actinomycetota bacterium]|nr:topoisomerase [Actinomycetota bacterium]
EKHFGELVDYDFTAEMEEDLDRIANGDADRAVWLHDFYFGAGDALGGLRSLVEDLGEIDARDVNSIPIGAGIVLRVGRYGPYVERGEERASVPEDLAPDELTVDKAEELLSAPSGERELGVHPDSGLPLVAKAGRYGPYVTEVLPDDAAKADKPRTGSLLATMSLDTVTLEDALRLLSLPRVVGVDPGTGEEITAQNGRYGPYLKRGSDSRSLASEEQMFDISLEEALAIYAQPKQRGRAAAAPLRDLGPDPTSGTPVLVKEGRFGAYVTDGETNATLRKGDTVESVTIERAAELLAEKRAKGPAPKKRTAKKAAKKAPAKKAATK